MYSSVMHKRAVTHLIALATVLFHSAGELVIAPQNTVSKVGDTTYFNCSTNLSSYDINWRHGSKYIYSGDFIIEPYDVRFEIDRNASDGSYNLVIHSVEPDDAGEYICIEVKAQATRRSARLIVLDADPDCESNMQPDGVIGQNAFNIPQDELQLTCAVTYYGSIPPQMEWKMVGDNSAIEHNAVSDLRPNNRLVYTLKLKGDISLHNSSYVCQINSSTRNQYQCTSEAITVLYFVGGNATRLNVVRGDEITCIANNSTFPCTSQWYHDNYTCPLSCEETITAHLLGEYVCKVKCHVRETDYFFDTLKVVVVEASKSGEMVATAVTPIIIVITLALSITISIVIYKRNALWISSERDLLKRLLNKKAHCTTCGIDKRNNKVEEGSKPMFEREIKANETSEGMITGMAILNKELFIVRETRPEIEVYDLTDDCCKSTFRKVKELATALDICSCKKNNCIYIMHEKMCRILEEVLKISKDGKVLKRWLTKDNAKGNLSATAEGNVVITVHDKHMLLEYSPEGKFLRRINLPECIYPLHAIKATEKDHYIVSHGSLIEHVHRVCLVNGKGEVEKSFGHAIGCGNDQLNMPYYLAFGSNGCVTVVDLFNDRLLSLNSNLEYAAKIELPHDHGFIFPTGICQDEQRLVVAVIDRAHETNIDQKGMSKKEEPECSTVLMNKLEDKYKLLVYDPKLLVKKEPTNK